MSTTIVYLHGFLSVGNSDKAKSLKAAFPEQAHLAPNLTFDPNSNLKIIEDLLRTVPEGPLLFVGTSLGGFWAHYLAQTKGCPCVIINPCIRPSETFKDRCGGHRNYVTNEPVPVTAKALSHYRELEQVIQEIYRPGLVNLFLAKDDDVLPYGPILSAFNGCSSLVVTESGGHRFTSEWYRVIEKVGEILGIHPTI